MREQTRLGVAFEAPGCETVLGDEATKQQEVDEKNSRFRQARCRKATHAAG